MCGVLRPRTQVAKALSDRGWRKWLRRPVVQHLWPQCLACFHKQGSAVRANTHLLVHHHQLRLCHLAPALAFLLADHPTVQVIDRSTLTRTHTRYMSEPP